MRKTVIGAATIALLSTTALVSAQQGQEQQKEPSAKQQGQMPGGKSGSAQSGSEKGEAGKGKSAQGATDTKDKAGDTKGKAAETKDKAGDTKGKAAETKDKAGDTKRTAEPKDKAAGTKGKAAETKDKAGDTKRSAQDKADDTKRSAQDKADDTKRTAKDKADDTKRTAKDKADDTKRTAEPKDKAGDTKGKAADTKDKAGDRDRDQARGKDGKDGDRDQARGKDGDRDRVNLTQSQRTEVREKLGRNREARVNNVNFSINIGTRVPRDFRLHAIPADIITLVPAYRGYRYFIVEERVVIVHPERYEIVEVIEVGGPSRGGGAVSASLELSRPQIALILEHIDDRRAADISVDLALGAEVPSSVELYEFPTAVVGEVPSVRQYRYVVLERRVLIVNPSGRDVIHVIDR